MNISCNIHVRDLLLDSKRQESLLVQIYLDNLKDPKVFHLESLGNEPSYPQRPGRTWKTLGS